MPDRVEEILKQIHVMFAKCDVYNNSPDKVIVSKSEMFELFEELNEAIYDVMDKYEATSRSREQARIEMDRHAAETVARAKMESDDVHAATMLYTNSMLEDLKNILEATKQKVKHDMIELMAEMELQQKTLEQNKESVRDGLTELHDSEMYLEVLTKLRKKADDKRKFGDQADLLPDDDDIFDDPKANAASNIVIRVDKPGENTGVTHSTRFNRNKKKKGKKPANTPAMPAEHEEGTPYSAEDFNLDAEYEQWKAEQEGTAEDTSAPKKGLLGSLFGSGKS